MAKCAQCGRNLPAFSFGKRICQWCVEYQAAQRGEISEDAVQRVMPAPWVRGGTDRMVTQAIFGINLAVFAAMVLAGVSVTDPTTTELIHCVPGYVGTTRMGTDARDVERRMREMSISRRAHPHNPIS